MNTGKHRRHNIRTLVLTALLTSLALVLGYLERMLPLELITIPGVKLGLANIVVVTGLYLFHFPTACGIALLKSGTTFLVSGSAVGFLYGLTGTLLSFLGMWLLRVLSRDRVSCVSVSGLGGMLHAVGQLAAAILITRTPALAWYLPVLLFSGLLTGSLVGVAVRGMLPYLLRIRDTH